MQMALEKSMYWLVLNNKSKHINMKNIIKYIIMMLILVAASDSLKAQTHSKADKALLPSNRPMPDKMVMQRKIENMRKIAREQEEQVKRAEAEKSRNAVSTQPADAKKTNR